MTSPTGEIAKVLWNLAVLVASSSTFQAACGITDQTHATALLRLQAALARVYWPGAELPDPVARPFAAIRLGTGLELNAPDTGGAGWVPKLPLRVLLERQAVAEDTPQERGVKFWNFAGGVAQDLVTLAKTAVPDEQTAPGLAAYIGATGYLYVTKVGMDAELRSAPTEKAVYDQAHLTVQVW